MFWIFTKIFYTIFYNISIRWQREILQGAEKVIFKFTNKEILEYIIFNGKSNSGLSMPPILFYLSVISGSLISILLISNLIVAFLITNADTKKQRIIESFKNSLKGAGLIMCVPILFLIFLLVFSAFQEILTYGFNNHLEKSDTSFTDMVHDLGWMSEGKQGIPGWDDLGTNYNPIITAFGFIFLGINFYHIAKQVISAILELLLYYFMGPFVAAKMSHDYGKSFNRWRDKVINKFLLMLGIIFVSSISIATINLLSAAISQGSIETLLLDQMQKAIIKLIIIIVGLLFITTANNTFMSILGESGGSEKKSIIKENLQKAFNRISNSKKQPQNGMVATISPLRAPGNSENNGVIANAVNKFPPISSNPIKSHVSNAVIKTLSQPNAKNNDKFQKSLSKK